MRLVIPTVIFILTVAYTIAAQSPCPKISVLVPTNVMKPGDSMTFVAQISGRKIDQSGYNWNVSNGTITSGQETASIIVETTKAMEGKTITATVEVIGLPADCPKYASGSVSVEGDQPTPECPVHSKMDEYPRISWADEKKRLMNVVIELKNDAKLVAYLIIYSSEKENSPSLKSRFTRITKFLNETHQISKKQVKIVFGGNADAHHFTVIYIKPNDCPPPPGIDPPV